MIEIKNLSFAYGHQPPVFDQLSHTFPGPIDIIVGPSGCGKSTLLKLVHGALLPSLGSVGFGERTRPRVLPLVLQDSGLIPWLTVSQNLALTDQREGHSVGLPVEIEEYLHALQNKRAWQMSFGQRRIIELVRAMRYGSEFLLLDEPFNYLDKSRRMAFVRLVASMLTTKRLLIATHDLEDFVGLEFNLHKMDQSGHIKVADRGAREL